MLTAGFSWSGEAQAVVVCPEGQKAIEATMTLNPAANDLFPLVRWNREEMQEEITAPGGYGELAQVLTEWLVDDSTSELNILDIATLSFTQADTNAVFRRRSRQWPVSDGILRPQFRKRRDDSGDLPA